ncbi:sulfite exporter taue/safe [Lucifera butyrica]|uniref:Probable membrane transporter protein n=1 Tax=Lucifera butyrica TaxID=1351585 RepID=A0A498RCW2_9FIRM|nr:sulfite exporter TauE/SafE family protein [Lucifera butyrica]VBB08885.1 sulfite exporter taue/safe [Lucifera butyrica]
MEIIALPWVGFLIGLLIISLGGGGGGIYVGILTAFFNVPPAIAAATSLATIIPTTTIGTISHWKAGNVNLHFGLIMMGGAVIGAIVGSLCSDLLPQSLYTKLTGILLLILGVQMIMAYRKKNKEKLNKDELKDVQITSYRRNASDTIKAVIYGFLGGAMSGLVGLSGSIPIVAGLTVLGCGALEMVGTSVFVLVGISIAGFVMHLGLGNVHWMLVGLLVLGTMSGAFLAPIILKRFSKDKLEKILPPILIGMTLVMGTIVVFK